VYTGDKLWNDNFVVIFLASNCTATVERQNSGVVGACVFTGHRVVARKNNQVTRMNGLTSRNNIPCMIMNVVEVGAIIGLVAWKRKRRHQRQRQFWVHPIYSKTLSLGGFYIRFERYRNYPDKFFPTTE
jgi:hypothetical protein